MAKRTISVLLLFSMAIPLILLIWFSIQVSIPHERISDGVVSPYVYGYQYDEFRHGNKQAVGYIRDCETSQVMSLYPYVHVNADCQVPLVKGDLGCYKIRNVQYRFQLTEKSFQVISTEFYTKQHWRKLYEQDGKIYEECLDKHWPFYCRNTVLELQEEDGFYDPISISGLGGCGVLLLSSDDPGIESNICVYILTKKGWEKTAFLMPDGTEQDYLFGYVRRWGDHSTSNGIIGNMEVCVKEQGNRYMIYQVTYSEGILILEASNSVEATSEDLLTWMY